MKYNPFCKVTLYILGERCQQLKECAAAKKQSMLYLKAKEAADKVVYFLHISLQESVLSITQVGQVGKLIGLQRQRSGSLRNMCNILYCV